MGIPEMKRINALNLEPTLPKLDDPRSKHITASAENQMRNASRLTQGADLKQEFQQSLEQIQKQEASKQRKLQGSGAEKGQGRGNPPPGDNQQLLLRLRLRLRLRLLRLL